MDFRKILHLNSGLTLVEILVSLSLIGIVSLFAVAIYVAHFRLFINQVTAIDVYSQNKLALDEITNQIRQSQSVVATCPSSQCPNDVTSTSTIVLQLWSLDSNGIPTGSAYDYVVYKANPSDTTSLIRTTYKSASSSRKAGTKTITKYLEPSGGLQFSYDQAVPQTAQVTLTITTTSNYGGKTQTAAKTARADLRNK